MSLLDRVQSPADLKSLTRDQLRELCADIRARLIDVCSRTGGHIGAGLGVVELTTTLHYVFNAPVDQLVWDVGHQAYPHKVLTERNAGLETLRQEHGLSGFLRRVESPYDAFGAGHAATAISAALGMAVARDLRHEHFHVVAILGDGALTSGMAYEGLNNAGATDRDVVVVLNDNEMSIAPNVGAMSKYLTSVQRNPLYNRVRSAIGAAVDHAPGRLSGVGTLVRKWEESVKSFFTPGVLFEELGFRYFGPIDGHDVDALVDTLTAVRDLKGPRLVHVITQKGKGFPAGEHGEKWHALPPGHDPATGKQRATSTSNATYTAIFGAGLTELGTERTDLVAITAAMPSGTGTGGFAKAHPDRFFDVGIAEGHAVTFAAGLATRGIRPVCAIYSTFLQRAYDSVIHDVAIQRLPVVFAMDRAGLVGEDGPTHMGLYDIAYMLAVPGMTVTAPKDSAEMLGLLRAGVEHTAGPFCLRYPRDSAPDIAPSMATIPAVPYGTWEVLRRGTDVAVLAVGTMVLPAMAAAATLAAEGLSITVVNCRYLKPYDELTLAALVADHKQLLVVEEGTVVNGFGAFMSHVIGAMDAGTRVAVHGVPDRFIEQASRARQLAQVGLDAAGIAERVRALHETEALAG
jgi:1-deoxy-D-xylulose-5-phosphate synthase